MRLDDGRALPAFMSQALNEDLTMFGDGSINTFFLLCFRFSRRYLQIVAERLSFACKHWQSAGNYLIAICRRDFKIN